MKTAAGMPMILFMKNGAGRWPDSTSYNIFFAP